MAGIPQCRLFTWLVHVPRIASLNQASTITLSGPHLNNKAPLGIIIINCVNHKTEFNTESEPSDRIELSDNT